MAPTSSRVANSVDWEDDGEDDSNEEDDEMAGSEEVDEMAGSELKRRLKLILKRMRSDI